MHMDGRKTTKSSWGEKLHVIVEAFWDLLFPRRCPVCDEILEPEFVEGRIHPSCRQKLFPVSGPQCMQCGRPLISAAMEYCNDCKRRRTKAPIVQGKALYLYQGAIKKTMYRLKYGNKREYALFLAEETGRIYGDWIRSKNIDLIVSVPMYLKKQKVRGYNQAQTLAEALGREFAIPVDPEAVIRIRDTTPQKELNDIERMKNLKEAFACTKDLGNVSNILLVDDIYTTGSTAFAVAEAIRQKNPVQIYFYGICIGKGD